MTMKVRPIKTETNYRQALAEIERLFDAKPNTPEGDCLEIWTTLVAAHEEKHFPIPRPDPIEAIRYHLESRSLSERDLEPLIGNRTKVRQILRRERALTFEMVRKLHQGLGLSADLLIRPYQLVREAA
jgi:HTH-type transcriptional regulator/antitoxin HigA